MQVIQYKTAKLFEASARLGAILCDAPPACEEAAAAYGRHLGTAFQIIDDVLDYSGDQQDIGKSVGDDLREGKPTLPLIYVMAEGTGTERDLVRQAIAEGSADNFPAVMAAIVRTGALDYARAQAVNEAEMAHKQVEILVPQGSTSAYREALLYFASYSVDRDR